jgi:hypothetical protein
MKTQNIVLQEDTEHAAQNSTISYSELLTLNNFLHLQSKLASSTANFIFFVS